MKRRGWIFLVFSAVALATAFIFNACQSTVNTGGNNADNVSCSSLAQPTCGSGANVMPVTIGPQSVCGQNGYVNEPCVSVKICTPNTSTCVTISNILLDTGSYGLRVYSSLLGGVAPTPIKSGGNQVAECALFGTGAEWGPIGLADVYLGGEGVAASVPIQMINPSYGNSGYSYNPNNQNAASNLGPANTSCADEVLLPDPATDGFNGILGVGVFKQDCGASPNQCVSPVGQYYACVGNNCGNNCTVNTSCGTTQNSPMGSGMNGIGLGVNSQVSNPIAYIGGGGAGFDNNGIALNIPDPGANGAVDITGCAMIGVATQTNNTPSVGASVYPADGNGNFVVNYSGTPYDQSFIDSGSNGVFFVAGSNVPDCSQNGAAPGFYCPSSGVLLSATNQGYAGSPSGTACFAVANAESLVDSGNLAFDNLAGQAQGYFDWGLPFFMGRMVYVGIQGQTQKVETGTGPFWAY